MIILLPSLIYPQIIPPMDIYKYVDDISPVPDSVYLADIINYIKDTLLLGGGEISNPQYYGNTKGVGLFRQGTDIGFSNGIILSNGYVLTTLMDNAENKNGAQCIPWLDYLGDYQGGGGVGGGLGDSDMDYVAGIISGSFPKPDTAVDPSILTFKFRPYYNSIHLTYVFASEEYKYQIDPTLPPPPPPPPVDFDLTGEPASDFMAILVKRFPSEMGPNNIASLTGRDAIPTGYPVSVKYMNHNNMPAGYYVPNYDKSFIFDGATLPLVIRPFNAFPDTSLPYPIVPCNNYWMKIGVADYPNGIVIQETDLSHQMNSAVFLKAFSLMSGYGLEWTVESAIDNPDFAGDSSLVEGGCSNINIIVKFNVLPRDTSFIRFKIGNASLSEYVITPPLLQDSLIMIPDSIMEWPMTITAIDDDINEGTNGTENWFIRYQMHPCDVPSTDTSGWGQNTAGYSGLIKVKVHDYNAFDDTTKIYGPTLPPPSSQYHCGGDVTVTITDILTGGIPPFSYQWTNPPSQFGSGPQFTTTIKDSPDYAYCTINDRCSDFTGYSPGKDTVEIRSYLTAMASPSIFQLCQNGHTIIKVANTNVGRDFTTEWYFQGNLVGSDSIYDVTWAEYGVYAPNIIDFICVVEDECGNTASDTVQASFFPVVSIQGIPLICLYDEIHLTCSPAQEYQWYYDSYPGTPIPGETFQDLYYTPPPPGNRNVTICVRIKNECGEFADTCFTFYVDEVHLDMKLDNSATDFSVCPNVPFTLEETSGDAVGGWEWTWVDNGPQAASGQTINLSLTDAGPCVVQVIAYNENGCYDTITRTVTVFPYSEVEAFTDLASVCIDYPAELSATTGPVTITNYYWTANPPDASLAGQQNSASPNVTPQVTTTYQCKIKDNNGCFDSTTVVVNVRPRIAVNIFANPDSTCTDKPVTVDFQTIVAPLPGAEYAWTFDDGVPATSTAAHPPQIIWSNAGLKTITLHIWEDGCDSTFTWHYMVNPDPLAAFTASNSFGCQPVTATFNNSSSNLENPTYLWEFGDGTTETQANPSHVYENPGAI